MKIKLLVDVGAYKAGYTIGYPDLVFSAVDGWQFVKAHEYEVVQEPRTTLSRRDEFAKAALAGLISKSKWIQSKDFPDEVASQIDANVRGSVKYADALIAELDKEKV
jgi:hypothetical protein